ncbi:cell division protein BolA [Enterovibrio norvegicus]|uniref:Cell division protein BolA n=1 Tax=Enterovibrio norvegicus TaxID=188144 RepID=A0A2N7LCI8_9GAMM|nr:BolA family iron metabolism protein IbaG [Enterovibrio norvegicus]MCC4799547.1 BolA family iron metabolism protein IbaG [Enterovibrio norvegicus]OEE51887.1 cell division protein BolA [Enterovibrio norvegicus]OEF52762.1 cell division protein BolA [Enterovibrio norvegicus]OEF57664.1 cell division protein BolA [Enterovibrio norvegicus]PMH67182.1 cell division protein BolA [Enterovibrio norvegicus]
MEPSEIKAILESTFEFEELLVKGDGSHFEVIAVGDMFDGMSRVKKQQTIYGPLMEHIRTNAIHALSIKALTPAEWARDKKLMQPL